MVLRKDQEEDKAILRKRALLREDKGILRKQALLRADKRAEKQTGQTYRQRGGGHYYQTSPMTRTSH